MIDYCCPIDRKLMFRAEEPVETRVQIFCKRCKEGGRNPTIVPIIKAEAVFQRTCRCTTCDRPQTIDCPAGESMVCIPCGTSTMVVEEEIRAPVPEAGRHVHPVAARRSG